MGNIDKALAALDVGLQSSTEWGCGMGVPDRCARCQRAEPVKGGDLCGGCREFLLGDSAIDPKRPQWLGALGVALESATATFTPRDIHEVRVDASRISSLVVDPTGGWFFEVSDPTGTWYEASIDFTDAMRRVGETLAVDPGVLAASFAALVPGGSGLVAHAEAEERRQVAQALVDAISTTAQAAINAINAIDSFASSAALSLTQAVGDVFAWLQESGLLEAAEPEAPKVRHARQARERELATLDRHRRSHRRTNRWGPPPGRASR